AAMHTPIQSRSQVVRDASGRVVSRHVLFREGQTSLEVSVADVRSPGWTNGDRMENFVADRMFQSRAGTSSTATLDEYNNRTSERNGRICGVLRGATGEALGDEPSAWWDWWNER